MTQGRRRLRIAATARAVSRALLLLFSPLLVCLSFAQEPTAKQPAEPPAPMQLDVPPPELPEGGPPFAPALSPDLLKFVTDRTGMPTVSVDVIDRRAEGEFNAWIEAVKMAKQTSAEGFANTVNKELTIAHVMNAPRKHRGAVLGIEGSLRRVRSFEAPAMLRQAGVETLYEAWLFNRERYGPQPICLVFTTLPEGLPVEEKIEDPPAVSFAGYFFKIYLYQAADPNRPVRQAPLLIGHEPILLDQARQRATSSIWQPLIAGVFGLIAVALLLAMGMAWWYSRGDHKISRDLADTSAQKFIHQAESSSGNYPDPNLN